MVAAAKTFKIAKCGRSDLAGDGEIACVIDLDNVLHRGRDEEGRCRDHSQLNILGLASALRKRGVKSGVVVRNRRFAVFGDRMWASLGLSTLAVGKNCDDDVIAAVQGYVRAGTRQIVLCAGDSDYCNLVQHVRGLGVHVECWARRYNASRKLLALSDGFRFIDEYISRPAEPGANDNFGHVAVPTQFSTALQKLLIEFVSDRGARDIEFRATGMSTSLCGVDRSGRPFQLNVDGDEDTWFEAIRDQLFQPSPHIH